MVSFVYMISPVLFISSVISSPIPPESTTKSSMETTLPSTTTKLIQETSSPSRNENANSRQLLITPIGDSILLTPLRNKQELVDDGREEDPNSMVEVIHENDEILQPSENIIFRPLFTYRTLQEQKRRRQINRTSESTTKKPVKKQNPPTDNSIRRRSSVYIPQSNPPIYYDIPFYYYNGAYYYPNL